MPSAEFTEALRFLPRDTAIPGDSFVDVRAKFGPLHGHPPGDDVECRSASYGGIGGTWVHPSGKRTADYALVFFHGGAFVSCASEAYAFYAARLTRATGAPSFIIDYRRAPEHRFPAALDDCADAVEGLVHDGFAPSKLAFVGDSCGGGLAVSTLLRLRERGAPMPACAATLCGWFDLEASGEAALHPVGEELFVEPSWIRDRGRDYVGPRGDPRDPLASPIHADLTGLPPLFLQAGQVDRCRDDSTRLATNAARDGVAVTLEIWPEMPHGFQGLYDLCPEAREAIARAGGFLTRHLAC